MDLRLLERQHQQQTKKRQLRQVYFFGALVLFIGAIYLAFFSGVFSIKEFEVQGSEKFSETDAKGFLAEFQKQKLPFWQRRSAWLWFNADDFASAVYAGQPLLASVNVAKRFPSKVLIAVKDREPKLIACARDSLGCFLVDERGVAYAQTSQFGSGSLSQISVTDIPGPGARVFSAEFVEQFVKMQQVLNQSVRLLVNSADLNFHLLVTVSDGWQIRLDPSSQFADRIADLKILLEQEVKENRSHLEYVDLTVPARAYYKLLDQSQLRNRVPASN